MRAKTTKKVKEFIRYIIAIYKLALRDNKRLMKKRWPSYGIDEKGED